MHTRTWFRLYSFTGVITGLLLFMICWSGTFATLAHEIDWLVTPEARVQRGDKRVGWGALLDGIRAAYPEAEVHGLAAPDHAWAAAQAVVDLPDQDRVRIYVDPYTAKVQGEHSYFNVWRFFRSFHRRLFLQPGALGIYLVSLFGLTLAVSLVTALFVYKRWWRRFFRFKPGPGRVFWSELHKITGLWSLWFVALMAITGIWYGLEQTSALDKIWAPLSGAERVAERAGKETLPLDTLVARAQEARPDLVINSVVPPRCKRRHGSARRWPGGTSAGPRPRQLRGR